MNKNNTYRGKNALQDFLDPSNHLTPIVELPKNLNPLYDDNVHIFIKLQSFLPLMNIKSIPAYSMLTKAKTDKKYLVESSSGNTAFSLSILSRLLNFKKTKSIVSSEITKSKLQMLLLSGSDILVNKEPICPNPKDPSSGINIAKRLAKGKKWLNLNQYDNQDNPKGHFDISGKQILQQINNDIQVFCSTLGTTGTMIGITQVLKNKINCIKTIGVVRKPNNPIPGPRTLGLLSNISFNWRDHCDEITSCSTKDAYEKSIHLFQHGLMAGPSSGMALVGLLKYLKVQKVRHQLDSLRNKNGEINCVFIAADTPFLYMEEYFKHLPESSFGKINNKILLPFELSFAPKNTEINSISSKEVVKKHLYKKDDKYHCKKNTLIVDVRDADSYTHSKIPTSINICQDCLFSKSHTFCPQWEDKEIVFVCQYGETSYQLAKFYKSMGINAYNLRGGYIEYSNQNLPRELKACRLNTI